MKKSLRTPRMKQIRLSEQRHKHELRKKRKSNTQQQWYRDAFGDDKVTPNIEAMFRLRRIKKSEKELAKQKQKYHDIVEKRRALKYGKVATRMG